MRLYAVLRRADKVLSHAIARTCWLILSQLRIGCEDRRAGGRLRFNGYFSSAPDLL